jgi:aminoglycoside phosphotransferase (APT) family kinase protein
MTNSSIETLLQEAGLWKGPVTLRPLKGGYLNEVILVQTGAAKLVLKRFAPETTGTLFPNRPEDEARALKRLEGLDVAPRLLGFWADASMMIYDYVEGSPWQSGTADVARLLLRKEAADPDGFRHVPLSPADIMAEGDALFARCNAPPPPRPAVRDLAPPARLSLIHTDLGPGNLIGHGTGLRIIDWQCPAAGDLAEDIYSFLSPAFQILSEHAVLTPSEQDAFWHALARPDLKARYLALRPFYAWRMAAYCLWRAETRPEAEVRGRYKVAYAAEITELDAHNAG